MMKKILLAGMLLFSTLTITACHQGNQSSNTSDSGSTQISGGKMDTSQINAPQVGLSDDDWNNSLGTVSDGQDTNSENPAMRILTDDTDSIVIYFSRSGSTELLASKVQAISNADVLELTVLEPYSSNYGETVERANEEREVDNAPVLNVDVPDLSQYQTVYLGYPIWGMTLAEPMASFLEEYGDELAGKTIAPFSTNGGYGLGSSVDRIASILSEQGVDANITDAYEIEGNKVDQADASLLDWFEEIGTTN